MDDTALVGSPLVDIELDEGAVGKHIVPVPWLVVLDFKLISGGVYSNRTSIFVSCVRKAVIC